MPESLVHVPNIIELAKKNPIDRSLVLHMQCSLQDVGVKISKIKKSEVSYDEFRRWEMSGGLDAGFSFCASGNIDHPEACAEMSVWLEVNQLGGEFLYLSWPNQEYIGKGCFINDRSFHFEIGLPNRVVRDILMKLYLFNGPDQTRDRRFGARIDIINLRDTEPNKSSTEFDIARIYL
jgi:hypothetical protein